ncbi:MAG: discoidin domain-containing protein [Clostridia bacterium]|nr:discoidin domain-containing protein [Clostridia bacterium]
MKRLLGIILAVAMVISLVTVMPAFAADAEILNIDFVKAYTDGGDFVSQVAGANAYYGVDYVHETALEGVDEAIASGASLLEFVAWYMPLQELADVGLRVDGGAVVYDGFMSYQQALVDAVAGWGDNYALTQRIFAYATILEGAHKVELVAKFTDDSEKTLYTWSYDTNGQIAVGKPVYNTATAADNVVAKATATQFWLDEFLVDGIAPVFDGATVVPLGTYYAFTNPDVDLNYYIDLQGIYDLSSVTLYQQGFLIEGFPTAYTISSSLDGVNWTVIADVEDHVIPNKAWYYSDSFATGNRARYVRLQCTEASLGPDGLYYVVLGEMAVRGTKVADVDLGGRAPYIPYVSNYVAGTLASGDAGAPSAWTGFTTGTLEWSCDFNTDVSFYAIGFPAFWSYPGTPLTIELSQDGVPVHEIEVTTAGDAPIKFDLGKTMPKGKYTLTMYIDDETLRDAETDPNNVGAYLCYTVVGYATEGILYDEDYFRFDRGTCAVDLYTDDVAGVGFVPLDHEEGDAILGDVDGDGEITDWDCIVFERYLAGWSVTIFESAMDLDADGEISDWDAIMLARYLAGWDVTFG